MNLVTSARLLGIQYRVEAVVLFASTGVGILAACLAVGINPIVLEACESGSPTSACARATLLVTAEAMATIAVTGIGLVVPPLVALLVGSQLVGREIERATAGLPWMLSGSRTDWLFARVLIAGAGIGAAAAMRAAPP